MGFKLSNETYDFLKFLVTKALPALGTLYFALTKIWGLPYGIEVVGTISAISLFLGTLIGVSTASYNEELFLKEEEKKKAELEAAKTSKAKSRKKKTPEITGE